MSQGRPRVIFRFTCAPPVDFCEVDPMQNLVSLHWPVVQLDFSDGMHMTENSYMPQSARMRAQIQIQANTGNFGRQRFSLHGVELTKFDGGGARVTKTSLYFDPPPLLAALMQACMPLGHGLQDGRWTR